MGGGASTGFKPPARGVVLGEVSITVLKYQVDPLLAPLGASLHIAIPVGTTSVGQLKLRVQGATGLPVARIRLMLCGAALDDAEPVPLEAFEDTKAATDDEAVFRPRLFLSLKPPVEEEARPPSVASEASEVDEDELRLAAEAKAAADEAARAEAELHAIREARTRELEERLRAEHMRPADFDLTSDLEKIGCAHFILPLRRAGFADEGAFASISDDVLQERGIWIPRKARVRIVALADSIKRRLEVRSHSRPGALREVERAMVTASRGGSRGQKINTRTVEGLDTNFTTKAAVTRAFEAKKKEEAKARQAELEQARAAAEVEAKKDEPREHDDATRRLIAAIHWRCTEDEFGLPIHCFRPEEPRFCCAKHQESSLQRRAEFLRQRAESNSTALAAAMAAADAFGKGVCSRAALRCAALSHLRREDYSEAAVPAAEVDALLGACVVSGEEQRRLEGWGREAERADCGTVGRIPAPLFDARAFGLALAAMLRDADEVRYLAIQRPFSHLPYAPK